MCNVSRTLVRNQAGGIDNARKDYQMNATCNTCVQPHFPTNNQYTTYQEFDTLAIFGVIYIIQIRLEGYSQISECTAYG